MTRKRKWTASAALALALCLSLSAPAFATGGGDVAGAVQSTWATASAQIKTVVDNVVFPAVDMILAVFFFVKLGTAYFDYQQKGQFEWTAPAILFVCLVFTLTAPSYIWSIIGVCPARPREGGDGKSLYGTLWPKRCWGRSRTGSIVR